MFFDKISEFSPALRLQNRFLKKGAAAPEILHVADKYLEEYCAYYQLLPDQACQAIEKFNERYQHDIKNFERTGCYPFELETEPFALSRTEYDLFLISSILFTRHRCSIAEELANFECTPRRCAFIGVGSGVELLLAPHGECCTKAFDLHYSDFILQRFPGIDFQRRLFTKEDQDLDMVYAIEILEHLERPEELLSAIHAALHPGGNLFCTIARNIPQFDHMKNMQEELFEQETASLFNIIYKKRIPHNYRLSSIGAENILYVLKRPIKRM